MKNKNEQKYVTESYATGKSITQSKNAAIHEKDLITENGEYIDITTVDHKKFRQEILLYYIINAIQNILTDENLLTATIPTRNNEKEIPVVTPPNASNSTWTFSLPYKAALYYMTGDNKSQNDTVKRLLDAHIANGAKYKTLINPYDQTNKKVAIPFEIEIDTTERHYSQSEYKKIISQYEKALDTEKQKRKTNYTSNILKNHKNREINYIQFKVHDWIVQGTQLKNLKQTVNEKKIQFYSIPKNFFPNLIEIHKKEIKNITSIHPSKITRHQESVTIRKIYSYIQIHDTHPIYSQIKQNPSIQKIELSLQDFLLHIKAEMTKLYKDEVYIRHKDKESIPLVKTILETTCKRYTTLALKKNFTGANFLPIEVNIDEKTDTITLLLLRPLSNKHFTNEMIKIAKNKTSQYN